MGVSLLDGSQPCSLGLFHRSWRGPGNKLWQCCVLIKVSFTENIPLVTCHFVAKGTPSKISLVVFKCLKILLPPPLKHPKKSKLCLSTYMLRCQQFALGASFCATDAVSEYSMCKLLFEPTYSCIWSCYSCPSEADRNSHWIRWWDIDNATHYRGFDTLTTHMTKCSVSSWVDSQANWEFIWVSIQKNFLVEEVSIGYKLWLGWGSLCLRCYLHHLNIL